MNKSVFTESHPVDTNVMRFTSYDVAGKCHVSFVDGEWIANIAGWHAKGNTKYQAALLVFMTWLNAIPPEFDGIGKIWFDSSSDGVANALSPLSKTDSKAL